MCAHATQEAPDPLGLEYVHCVLMGATRQHQEQLCARYVRQGNLRPSVVQMRMCALATLDPQERMDQEHVHHVSLVNTNQWRDLLNAQGVRPASFLLSLVQFRTNVLAMLERLDQMGLKHVPCVMLVITRQQQDLLHALCARAASFLQ